MKVYIALEWWPNLEEWDAEPDTSQADALAGVARALKRGHRAALVTADMPAVVSADVPVVAGSIADPETVAARIHTLEIMRERDEARAVLALIAEAGGTTTEEGLHCNGTWCGEQARAFLDAANASRQRIGGKGETLNE
jgi:hypothetical protein